MLYYIILYYFILFYIILYYFILYYSILHYNILYYVTLFEVILYIYDQQRLGMPGCYRNKRGQSPRLEDITKTQMAQQHFLTDIQISIDLPH